MLYMYLTIHFSLCADVSYFPLLHAESEARKYEMSARRLHTFLSVVDVRQDSILLLIISFAYCCLLDNVLICKEKLHVASRTPGLQYHVKLILFIYFFHSPQLHKLKGKRNRHAEINIVDVNAADQIGDSAEMVAKYGTEETTYAPSRVKGLFKIMYHNIYMYYMYCIVSIH